jgi:hypothetical protein
MDTQPEPNQAPPIAAPEKKSFASIFALLGLLVVAVACYFIIPKVLTQIYFNEEQAKRKVNIVGQGTDREPPPGTQIGGSTASDRPRNPGQAPSSSPASSAPTNSNDSAGDSSK